MDKIWSDDAWEGYLYWQTQDKKTLKKINNLIKDIDMHDAFASFRARENHSEDTRLSTLQKVASVPVPPARRQAGLPRMYAVQAVRLRRAGN